MKTVCYPPLPRQLVKVSPVPGVSTLPPRPSQSSFSLLAWSAAGVAGDTETWPWTWDWTGDLAWTWDWTGDLAWTWDWTGDWTGDLAWTPFSLWNSLLTAGWGLPLPAEVLLHY